jgi:tripartite-type tricarboxylate transporter receptor subunit TctC
MIVSASCPPSNLGSGDRVASAHSERALKHRRAALGMLAVMGSARRGWAQSAYPSRPVTLIVPFAPGGIADMTARLVAEPAGQSLGQPLVVENRPGAGSIAGASAVARARPDGYTLLLMSNAQAVSASLFRKIPFDASTAFSPITTLGYFDLGIFVGARSRYATLGEVLADAKAHPGKLNIGTISIGSTQHLAAELLKTVAGIDATVVPFTASPAVVSALRAGDIDLAIEIVGPMLPQLSGKVCRVLAVTAHQRMPVLPDVSTAQEAGLAGYEVASWNALAAPMGTPAAVIAKISEAVHLALDSAALRTRLLDLGIRPQASSPQALQALLASETRRWGDVIRTARIQPQ